MFFFFFFSFLTPFLLLSPPLLDGVEPDRPRRLFPNKRGLDLLPVVRASFESGSPPDPSLMVIGSPTSPDWGGSGPPSWPWGRGISTRPGDGKAVPEMSPPSHG